nr:prolyl 4-hydroxylase subunit alpha-3-like [Procambarus clarkii]
MIGVLAWLVWSWAGVARCDPEPGHLYTSLALMDDLFAFDKLVGDLLPLLPEHIPEASRYLESYWSVAADRDKVGGQVTSVALTGNPLHVYSVIKRLSLYWPALNNTLQAYHTQGGACEDRNSECHNWARRGHCLHTRPYMILNCRVSCGTCPSPELGRVVTEALQAGANTVLPTLDDLKGAAFALARLQSVYHIPIGHFMQGRLGDTFSSVRLTVEDCVRVGNATRQQERFSDAWTWFTYCLASAGPHHPSMHAHITALLDEVTRQHDAEWKENHERFFPLPLALSPHQVPWDTTYGRVCRGQRPQAEDGRLQCHVSSRGAPYLLLQPVRYQQVHHHPDIFLFYEVLSDHEIAVIKERASTLLTRSTVSSRTSPYSEERVSHTAWLPNHTHPALLNVARRISYITGLHVHEGAAEESAGEHLQVVNYGIGGHYNMHQDTLFKHFPEGRWNESMSYTLESPPGDRVATWVFYLTTVESGGRTGFERLGASVPAIKGAAAFWYNLKKNGDGDPLTTHGGCPVILGHKWIANKWIREHANFLRRPCSEDPEE